MQMDGQADLVFERRDQLFRRIGLEQARHVLDAQHMRTALFDFLRQIYVVAQRIFVALGIEDVAGVADRGLAQLSLVQHLVHGDLHAGQPVERIEHAEHIDARPGRLAHERAYKVVRIIGVADQAGAAQQHLKWDIRDFLAQQFQALPRRLVQEAVRGVERRAAPHLERKAPVQDFRCAFGGVQHVAGAHAGGQQRLMGVAHGGVGEEQALFIQHISLDRLRAFPVKQLLEALTPRRRMFIGREARRVVLGALGGRVFHLDLRDIAQHLGRAVAALPRSRTVRAFRR